MKPDHFGKPVTIEIGISEKTARTVSFLCPKCDAKHTRQYTEQEASFEDLHVEKPPEVRALGGRRV
jgi:hypothetical protein